MPINMVPGEKPRLSSTELRERIAQFGLDRQRYPLVVVGIRGYYRNCMGAPSVNDRGIYDDALFIHTVQGTVAFNANTDPSVYRKGHGTVKATKGMASLKPGAWLAYRLDNHVGKSTPPYFALCQRAGDVTVISDGNPDYEDTGRHGINIHRGGYSTTSSEGCQTIHPAQWDSFIQLAKDQAKRYFGDRWNKETIPYVLLEG